MATETRDGTGIGSLDGDRLREGLRLMLTIRYFDERALALYRAGEMRGTTHPYIGMEAVGVGGMLALRPDDYVTSTHRGHGHTIAKGGDINKMMAELLGRSTGYSGGKGGSMHIADLDKHMLGANGIVGGGVELATGAALTAVLNDSDDVAVCFFGDGALEQGILHECTNLAAVWNLPLLCARTTSVREQPVRSGNTLGLVDRGWQPGWPCGGVRHPGCRSRRDGFLRRARRGVNIDRARAGWRRSELSGLRQLSLSRPPCRRSPQLPHARGGRPVAAEGPNRPLQARTAGPWRHDRGRCRRHGT